MPSLDSIAPDQRAVVQLVLRQGRSYEDLAGLLGISEEAVRRRAHAGVEALGGGADLPADQAAQLADYLLGQQEEAEQAASREVLARDPAARAWARAVAAELGEDAARLPEIPEGEASERTPSERTSSEGKLPEGKPSGGEPSFPDGELSEGTPPAGPDRPEARRLAEGEPPAERDGRVEPEPREERRLPSSKLGGALLIGGLAIAVAAVLLILFTGGDDDDPVSAAPTAQPTATPQARTVGEIPLRAAGSSNATGVMRLVTDGRSLGFEIEAQRMPRNRSDEAYAVWFVNRGGGSARRLGFANPVGDDGALGVAGPTSEDQARFADLLARYDQVVVARERDVNARRPGRIVLRGTLPRAGG